MAQELNKQPSTEITCQEVAEWTSSYLDAHVGDERDVRIALHLATCAGCETYVKQIATVRDVVGLLPRAVEKPSDFHRLQQAFFMAYPERAK